MPQWFQHWFRVARVLFFKGPRGVSAYQYFGRELTDAELTELDAWFDGVSSAMDGVSKQLGKMPHFPIRGKNSNRAAKRTTEGSKP